MSGGKKVLNVLGIIASIFLSIVLVVTLLVTPVMFSACSLFNANNFSKLVKSVDIEEIIEEETSDDEESELLLEVLESDIFEEIIDAYSKDVSAVLLGKDIESKVDADFVEELLEENVDELVEFLEESDNFDDKTTAEIRREIKENIDEISEEFVKELPTAKELKRELVRESDEAEKVFDVIENLSALKATIIGTIIVLSGLIFVCRLFDFRGFKWLYIDLFIASAFSALVCVGLSIGKGFVGEIAEGEAGISTVIEEIFSIITTGTIIRTVVMLVAAIGLVVAYIFVKKALAKKSATQTVEETVEETPVLEESENTAEL